MSSWNILLLVALSSVVTALRYDPEHEDFNLNQNKTAVDPIDYWGRWEGHVYEPSPENWRFPFYTLYLDRYVNGDPTNDNANGTVFEQDLMSNQLRYGGDVHGLQDSLDYLQGMGIRVRAPSFVFRPEAALILSRQCIYIAGSPHINMPWAADSYSPLDLTLLDGHFGTIQDWRDTIAEAHKRGIYVMLENTMSTSVFTSSSSHDGPG